MKILIVLAVLIITPTSISKSKHSYEKEVAVLTEEYEYKLAVLSEKYHRGAKRGKRYATKKGNVESALEWREWEDALRRVALFGKHGPKKNLARLAKITSSNSAPGSTTAALNDGSYSGRYWRGHPAQTRHLHAWLEFDLRNLRIVDGVRIVFFKGQNEPTRYSVALYERKRMVKKIAVHETHHNLRPVGKRGLFESTIEFPSTQATRVRFEGYKDSNGDGPILFEFEVLGE